MGVVTMNVPPSSLFRSPITRCIVLAMLILTLYRTMQHMDILESVGDLAPGAHFGGSSGDNGRATRGAQVPLSPPRVNWTMPPSTTSFPMDSEGCYAAKADTRVTVMDALSMSVNLTAFSDNFKEYFAFDHVPSDWAAMSGSGVWLEAQQTYVTSTRIIRKPKGCADPCLVPLESFVYLQAWDSQFNSTTLHYEADEYMVHIPRHGRVAEIFDVTPNMPFRGPEDARMSLDSNHNMMLTFNMADHQGRRYWSYNVTSGRMVHLKPASDQDWIQKNWAPFMHDNTDNMAFIYSFSPLRVLHCHRRSGECVFKTGGGAKGVAQLRGGTPLVRYANTDYFVGIARTMQVCSTCEAPHQRIYRPNIVVLFNPRNSRDSLDLVYVSEPLDLGNVAIRPPFAPENTPDTCGSFVIPCGFLRWKLSDPADRVNAIESGEPVVLKDEAFIELSVQDSSNVLVKVQGMEQLVVDVIATNEQRIRRLASQHRLWSPLATSQVRCAEQRLIDRCPRAKSKAEMKPE